MSWSSSDRASRLPKDWRKIRARILKRDRHICHVCGKPGADEVDHVQAGDNHHDTNLAAIHGTPCHKRKTQREARAAVAARPKRRRAPEAHPGRIT